MKRTLLVLLTACVAPASSTTITIMPATGIASAVADRAAWLAANFDPDYSINVTVTFENVPSAHYSTLATDVGTFSLAPGCQPGDPIRSLGDKSNQFAIFTTSNTPYIGRFNTTDGGNKWLDSNDLTELQLTTSLSDIYFFITDVSDVDGLMRISTADGTTATFPTGQPDGNIFFVGITSQSPLGTVRWSDSSTHDGFGLDDFGRVNEWEPVPEPSAVPLLLLGMAYLLIKRARAGQA